MFIDERHQAVKAGGSRLACRTVRIVLAASLLATTACLSAEPFPQRPVRMIMPFAPGGGSDSVGRLVALQLGEIWKQPVVVDSRLGAGGNIGAEIVAKAAADGHTLLFNTAALLVAPNLYRSLSFDPVKDFLPLGKLGFSPAALLVAPQVNANSVGELIALAKSQPGKLSYGSAGNGSAVHLATELLGSMAGVRIEHVPYKGGNLALIDLVAGRLQILFSPLGSSITMAKGGKVRLLAVTTAQRSPFAPDVPTIAESGVPGYDFSYWWGLFAPARLAPPLATQINRDIQRALDNAALKAKLEGIGVTASPGTLAEFAAEVKRELTTWADVTRRAGVKPQ